MQNRERQRADATVNNDSSVPADSTLSACIRSLPLAVLQLLHFKLSGAFPRRQTDANVSRTNLGDSGRCLDSKEL